MTTPFKLELDSKTVTDKLTLGTAHITAMTDNTRYPAANRVPSDAQFLAAQTELQASAAKVETSEIQWRQSLSERDDKEAAWDQAVTARAAWCAAMTPGDTAALTSTGFSLRKTPEPIGTLQAPAQLRAEPGPATGSLSLRCQATNGAGCYEWQCRPQAELNAWSVAKTTTAARLVVPDLTPGTMYVLRVRAIGAAGPSDWSAEVSRRAP